MTVRLEVEYLEESLRIFRRQKRLGEEAMAQLRDEEIFRALDQESNSVAIIVKHMSGNMRSRWADFLTADGEKPDRNRDQEFIIEPGTTRERVTSWWEDGWHSVFQAVESLGPEDLGRSVFIRGLEHSVIQAIHRQLDHYAYHVGQIVFLAKHWRGSEWKSLSIPRGKSVEFNARMLAQRRGGATARHS